MNERKLSMVKCRLITLYLMHLLTIFNTMWRAYISFANKKFSFHFNLKTITAKSNVFLLEKYENLY